MLQQTCLRPKPRSRIPAGPPPKPGQFTPIGPIQSPRDLPQKPVSHPDPPKNQPDPNRLTGPATYHCPATLEAEAGAASTGPAFGHGVCRTWRGALSSSACV